MKTIQNTDTGSLPVGLAGTEKPPYVGRKFTIEGEGKVTTRVATYVMGSVKKGWFVCFKGQGALPVGEVTFEIEQPSEA